MAFVKFCDNCNKSLGGSEPFLQIRGTVCDQYEPTDGPVKFRYLTASSRGTHCYCNEKCELEWRGKQRKGRGFVSSLYERE